MPLPRNTDKIAQAGGDYGYYSSPKISFSQAPASFRCCGRKRDVVRRSTCRRHRKGDCG